MNRPTDKPVPVRPRKKLAPVPVDKPENISKREKIPRKILSHGRNLSIYRRVSWEKTNAKSNSEEIDKLYKWVTKGISAEAKNALNWLMNDYEKFTKKELK